MSDRIKYLTNIHAEGILRALRTGGFLATDQSATDLRNLDQGMTDVELDAIINGLSYGSASGTAAQSPTDYFVLIDNDALPAPPESHTNYFRVMRWQDTSSIDTSNAVDQMMSVYWPTGTQYVTESIIGPDTPSVTTTAPPAALTMYSGRMYLGGYKDTVNQVDSLGYIGAGSGENTWGFLQNGMRLHASYGALELSSRSPIPAILFTYADENHFNANDPTAPWATGATYPLGGFVYNFVDTKSMFFIGDVDNDDAIRMEGTTDGFRVTSTDPLGGKQYTWGTDNPTHDAHWIINWDTDADRQWGGPAGNASAIFSVVGSDIMGSGNADAVIAARNVNADYKGSILYARSNAVTGGSVYRFLHCIEDGDSKFILDSNGDGKCDGAWTGGGADVAEMVDMPEVYEVGTVLIMDTDGDFKPSAAVADTKVIGVIAKKPGVKLGVGVDETPPPTKQSLTVCGITPVKCTTAGGPIAPGDLLVSSENGYAQKAGDPPAPGTILGKAFASLEQPAEETVTGEVSAFVNLQ